MVCPYAHNKTKIFFFVLLMERRVSFQILRVKRIKRLPWFLIKSIVN